MQTIAHKHRLYRLPKFAINIFRYTQSLDDQKLVFWRPHVLEEVEECPFIYFLKLEEGNVFASTDFGDFFK